MSKKRTYTAYSPSFKQEAVAWVTEQGYSVAETATALGVNPNLIYKWKERLETEANGQPLRVCRFGRLIKVKSIGDHTSTINANFYLVF